MRHWIALVTAALLAPSLVVTHPATAQTAPTDPESLTDALVER